jgi:hypothetical protein
MLAPEEDGVVITVPCSWVGIVIADASSVAVPVSIAPTLLLLSLPLAF